MQDVQWIDHARSMIRAAVSAPSSHNTQPWFFRVSARTIDLWADRTRALPVNDPEDRELTISCGCALMNLRIAAAAEGFETDVEPLPAADEPDWLARIAFRSGSAPTTAAAGPYGAVPDRRTYRKRFESRPVDTTALDAMMQAALEEGVRMEALSTAESRRAAVDLIASGDAMQWANPSWRRELAAWMHPRRRGDGLCVPLLAAPIARLVVRAVDMGSGVGARDQVLAEESPLLAVLCSSGDRVRDWLKTGQGLERVLLIACRHGLQASHLNQPIQVATLRHRLQDLVGSGFPQILLRIGYPTEQVPPSPRRPVDDCIEWIGEHAG